MTLIVDDFDAKRQQVFNLNFALPASKRNEFILGDTNGVNVLDRSCFGFYCEEGLSCKGDTQSADGCCYTECISTSQIIPDEVLGIPLIVILAVLLLILAGAVLYSTIKAVKK
jgi:hypothetical protein